MPAPLRCGCARDAGQCPACRRCRPHCACRGRFVAYQKPKPPRQRTREEMAAAATALALLATFSPGRLR